MKVIFLDFDGVLNSENFAREQHQKGRRKLTMQHILGRDLSMAVEQIDPEAIKVMNWLVAAADAHVVISSTWRRLWSMQELKEVLKFHGADWTDRIIDKTPMKMGYVPRGTEIKWWLENQEEAGRIGGEPVTSFVILDDDSDMDPFMDRLVNTDPLVGITMDDAKAALGILRMG